MKRQGEGLRKDDPSYTDKGVVAIRHHVWLKDINSFLRIIKKNGCIHTTLYRFNGNKT